jgi:hypothetical protein
VNNVRIAAAMRWPSVVSRGRADFLHLEDQAVQIDCQLLKRGRHLPVADRALMVRDGACVVRGRIGHRHIPSSPWSYWPQT